MSRAQGSQDTARVAYAASLDYVFPGAAVREWSMAASGDGTRDLAATGGGGVCPISNLRDRLRRSGLRPTQQRLSLGWLMFGRGDRHLTADVLYEEAIRAKVPVSLATVYNTLNQFTEAGLLRQLALDAAKAVYDTDVRPHHHFLFEEDGTVVDMPVGAVAVGALPEPPEGMEVSGVDVVVRVRRVPRAS